MFSIIAAVIVRPPVPAFSLLRRAIMVTTLVSIVTGSSACSKESTSPRPARLVYGAAQALGQGTARTFVTLDQGGQPSSLGVAISESAMGSLPQHPMPGMPSAAMLTLTFPAQAVSAGYDHVMLDWNPAGHEPEHVYTHPHFDFHFFQITPAERDAMHPGNPQFGARTAIFPGNEFVPAGFLPASTLANVPPAAAAVPLMGMHWLDTSSPELQPPPHGKTFTTTFIWGSYDGRFIFLEPMITKAFIESARTSAGGFSYPVATPAKVAISGAYPSRYSITYNATAREYRIALDGLAMKASAP